MHSHINFGYAWYWTYGSLAFGAVFLPLLLLGWARKCSKVWMALFLGVTFWSLASFLIVRFGMDINGRLPLPTQAFFTSGTGKVLDIGAGTGRSTLMVLEARPRIFVVALDRFGEEYADHFGHAESGEQRLLHNLKAAGVDQRASIQAADMRQMPFAPATFDAIVSAYTFEHLGRKGIRQAMAEASRVLKPGGDFLLMVIAKDSWLKLAWGPIALHSHLPGKDDWTGFLRDAGFNIVEVGTRPATLYILARKVVTNGQKEDDIRYRAARPGA